MPHLFEPLPLGGNVDQAVERQQHLHLADHLHRRGRCGVGGRIERSRRDRARRGEGREDLLVENDLVGSRLEVRDRVDVEAHLVVADV